MTPPGPYLGIRPFGYADRANFHGRTAEVEQVLARMLMCRILVLFGESGAGKSSLLNAGLIPSLLKERFLPERVRVRPSADRPLAIERIASNAAGTSYLPSAFEAYGASGDQSIPVSIDEFSKTVRAVAANRPPVLIVDQFEELHTLFGSSPAERKLQSDIEEMLRAMVGDETLPVKLLIAVREDYVGKLEPFARRFSQALYNRLQLHPLSESSARAAILEPFQTESARWPSSLTPSLADQIVADIGQDGGNISSTQLQIVCSTLWDHFAGSKLRIGVDEYGKLGGFRGIVSDYLKNELRQFDAAVREVSLLALSRMITASGTRDIVSQDNLSSLIGRPEAETRAALDALEKRRLITRSLQRDTVYCEIANEYLIPAIQSQSEELRIHQAVAGAESELKMRETQALQRDAETRRMEAAKVRAGRFAFAAAILALVAGGLAYQSYRTSQQAVELRRQLEQSQQTVAAAETFAALQESELRRTKEQLEALKRKQTGAGFQEGMEDSGMFRILDVLLGFALLVLMASLAVMLITQAVTNLLNRRGLELLEGLADILQQLDPALPRDFARKIAQAVLMHRSVSKSRRKMGLGDVVFRDQFTRILLELASGRSMELNSQLREALLTLLQRNGISDPGRVLFDVANQALKIEFSNPQLSESERQNVALLSIAPSAFVGGINDWFDRTVERVSQRFTRQAQLIAFTVSMLLVSVIQFDTFAVINRLAIDPQTRTALVERTLKPLGSGDAAAAPDDNAARIQKTLMNDFGFFKVPRTPSEWAFGMRDVNLIGILLSALLLSTGAPFWYNILKHLIGLRSLAARRDDMERIVRQTPGMSAEFSRPDAGGTNPSAYSRS